MKRQSTFVYILRLALTLLAITAVTAALLAGVNALTADRIAAIHAQKARDAVLSVLPDGENAVKLDNYPDGTGMVRAVYASASGYAIEVAPTGFGGEIRMMVGISPKGTVLGVSIISHTETAGLGAVAGANSVKGQTFRSQFNDTEGVLAVTKDGGEIDALSGATITSRAVTQGVNAALACAEQLNKEAAA